MMNISFIESTATCMMLSFLGRPISIRLHVIAALDCCPFEHLNQICHENPAPVRASPEEGFRRSPATNRAACPPVTFIRSLSGALNGPPLPGLRGLEDGAYGVACPHTMCLQDKEHHLALSPSLEVRISHHSDASCCTSHMGAPSRPTMGRPLLNSTKFQRI